MPPPLSIPSHVVQMEPVSQEEVKAAHRKENEQNRQMKEQRQQFIAENA